MIKYSFFSSILLLTAGILILEGCNSQKDSKLYFSNNIESSFAWTDNHATNIIRSDGAHSGNYVCKIDSRNPYSVTFNMKLSDISSKLLKSVHISAWIKLASTNSSPQIVADIRDSSQKTLEWLATSVKEIISTPDRWQQAVMNVTLSEKNRNNPDNYLRIYVTNGANDYSLVDDIEIRFMEK